MSRFERHLIVASLMIFVVIRIPVSVFASHLIVNALTWNSDLLPDNRATTQALVLAVLLANEAWRSVPDLSRIRIVSSRRASFWVWVFSRTVTCMAVSYIAGYLIARMLFWNGVLAEEGAIISSLAIFVIMSITLSFLSVSRSYRLLDFKVPA